MVFFAITYGGYCLLCYAQDTASENIFSQKTLMGSLEYMLAPHFSISFSAEMLIEIGKIHLKIWYVYPSIALLFFLIATSGYGNEYKGVEKGAADWATKIDEEKFGDHTGIPMGRNFYATVKNPNIKEIGKDPHKPPKKLPKKKLQGSFYSPHNLNETVIGGSGAGKSIEEC
jgi:hypothetical protein